MTRRKRLARWITTLVCAMPGVALAEPHSARLVSSASMADEASVQSGAADSAALVRIESVSVPRSASDQTRAALRAAVAQNLATMKLEPSSATYSVSVSLLKFRRYVDPGETEARMVCIVDVALHDEERALIGSLRGRASGSTSAPRDVLDAAARSALSRLPEALRLAQQAQIAHGGTGAFARR
ncbi:MAG TPA: hypothetical protein VHU80_18235 [Polyangiaceae bacterium]|jgi:hypothetical protein|nr:hypothetical protein [Polyangiaceae bacterium]